MRIFSREIHRPSEVKLWQIPAAAAFPIPPGMEERLLPLEEQDTSYFAESARILIFSRSSIKIPPISEIIIAHTFFLNNKKATYVLFLFQKKRMINHPR